MEEYDRHSIRWLWVRVNHLPSDAATWVAMRQQPQRNVTKDPEQIARFFGQWGMA